ncbi:unnamed protein product [Peronospora farinosa]|uniref:Uncharacterized protein n=1 Tax=Peronospora farinosa TaxID=134698 RepID=A0AAV0UUK3_9STRA|nr:unnamed protein product [Peronospora farinosa]CAI5740561.1 unnamed protein product [Peronospora farinosa]
MKVKFSPASFVKMIRAALKAWQCVAKYTTKPLLSQGVEGDVAMAKNCRRSFNVPGKKEQRINIALEDKIKLITPEKVIFYTLSAPRVRVVALANWEAAPTFVLDEHLRNSFFQENADGLLHKCNPFLSGKRRAHSDDDIVSETPTVSTDCSVIPESDVESQKLNEEVKEKKISVTLETQTRKVKADQVYHQCNDVNTAMIQRNKNFHDTKPNKHTSHWMCVGYGRYIKQAVEQTT